MTTFNRPLAALTVLSLLAATGAAQTQSQVSGQTLIPAPSAPSPGAYAQYIVPGAPPQSGMAVPSAPALGLQPAGLQPPAVQQAGFQTTGGQAIGVHPAGLQTTGLQAPGLQPAGTMSPHAAAPQAVPMSGVWPGGMIGNSAVVPAGCNDCAPLWANACDDAGGSIGACLDGECAGGCGTSCSGACGLWAHYTSVSASLLYLRPRNAEVAYAVPIDGPIANAPANNPIQIGDVGVVDPDYEAGFGASVNLAVNAKTSLYGEIMMFDSSTSDQVATAAPDVMRSIVSHPSSTSAATDFLSASSGLDIEFDTFDAGIRHLFVGGQVFAVNYLVGARYSRLDQSFGATYVDNGTETVNTDIDFEGAGLRLGLEAERQSCRSRLRLYTRGSTSFLAGRFRANYLQGQSFDPTVVDTSWEAGRVVPVLDLELGAGWSSCNGRVRLNAGYLVSAWFNTVTTDDFVRAVQQNDFINLGDTLTFDGLRASAELRF